MIGRRVNNLSHQDSFSYFRAVSSEHRALDGKRVHMALLDELMEHRQPLVADKMSAGTKGRRQPLILEATNSGYARTSICWQHHEYSRQVVEGTIDNDEWFCYAAGLDEGDDPLTDETCWGKANPSLGTTIQMSYLRSQVKKAVGIPSEQNTVLRLNFCVWTAGREHAIDMAAWDACPSAPVDDDELRAAPCYAGVDLGLSSDFSAFVLLWMLPDGRVVVRPTMWVPEAAIERHPRRRYAALLRKRLLTVSPGEVTDFQQVQETILTLCQEWYVRECVFDRRFMSQMAQNLEAAGVVMIDHVQGLALNEAVRRCSPSSPSDSSATRGTTYWRGWPRT